MSITVSIGLAELSPEMPNLEALFDTANQAEHDAKELGRNRVVARSASQAAAPTNLS